MLKGLIKKSLTISLAATVLLASMPASATSTTFDADNQTISFFAPGNGVTEVFAGADASTAPFRYEDVITISGTKIDALVSIVQLQNSGSDTGQTDNKLDRLDKTNASASDSQAGELEAQFSNSASTDDVNGHAIFDIQFLLDGTNTPVTLTNVVVTVADIDNDQYVQFSGLTSYKLSPARIVEPRTGTSPTTWGTATSTTSRVSALTGNAASFTSSNGTALTKTVPSGSVMFFASQSSSDYRESSSAGAGFSSDLFVAQVNFSQISTLRAEMGSYENSRAVLDFAFQSYGSFSAVTPVSVSQPSFTVTYDANTGTGTPPTSTSGTGALSVAGSLSTPGISRTGYTFAGWNTRADGTGVAYAPGSTILPVANTTLFAVWNVTPTPTPTPAPASTTTPAPVSTTTPAPRTTPAPMLATTGTDSSGAWIATGLLTGAGAVLLGVRRAMRKKIS